MPNKIQDWVVELDISTTKADKKLKTFEKRLSKVAASEAKIHKQSVDATKKQTDALRKQNTLEAQRLALRKKINQAEQLGIKDLKAARGALGGPNPLKIRAKVLELDKQITAERKKQRIAEAKIREETAKRVAAEKAAKTKQANIFSLKPERRQEFANTIDSVVRRARHGLDPLSEDFKEIEHRAARMRESINKIGDPSGVVKLRDEIRRLREDTTRATSAARAHSSELKRQRFVANATADSIRNLARSYVSVFAAIEGGRSILRTGTGFENLSGTMLLSSGSAEQAAKDFDFLTKLSIRLGLGLQDTSAAFAKFGVAARGAGLDSAKTNEIFTDLSETIRATNLTADRANLAFLGFQQMLAGPVVQAQEMNQLIEQIPQFSGAAQKALKEMGFEVDNYREAVATGTVDSKEFVEVVTRIMSEQAKSTGALEKSLKTITAQTARLRTAWEQNVLEFFEAGGGQGIAFFLEQLTFSTQQLKPAFINAGKFAGKLVFIIGGVVRVVGSLVSILNSLAGFFNNVIGGFGGINSELDKTAEKFSVIGTIFDAMKATAKGLVGLVLMLVGAVERSFTGLANIDFSSFSAFRKSFTEQRALLGESFAKDFSANKQRILESRGMGASSVNSGNTITANISVANGDPEVITNVVKDVLQNTYKVAY